MATATPGLTPAMRELASQASSTSFAAVTRLKQHYPNSIPYQDLIDYLLSVQQQSDTELLRLFRLSLQKHREVTYDSKAHSYRYKPPYEISSAGELLRELQRQDLYKGIPYDELKQGWPECLVTLNQLADEHKVLIHRHKKDKIPKTIWPDDPSLYVKLDEKFCSIANGVPLPDVDKIRVELGGMQSRAAGEAPKPINASTDKKPKKKARRGQKVTNTHMQALESYMKKK
jgi:transcription initiation factor TFIIE subunit beta